MHENMLILSHHQIYLNMTTFKKTIVLIFCTPITIHKNNNSFKYLKKIEHNFQDQTFNYITFFEH
jgi:hypothetical protein